MSTINPVQARAFVNTIIKKFDEGLPQSSAYSNLENLLDTRDDLLDAFEKKEIVTEKERSDLDSELYELYAKSRNLSELVQFTGWLSPHSFKYDQKGILNKVIEAKFKEWKIQRQESLSAKGQLCIYVFEKAITSCKEEEWKALFGQLEHFYVYLNHFKRIEERLICKIQGLFTGWSEAQKTAAIYIILAAAFLINWFAFPLLKVGLRTVAIPALIARIKLYGPVSLVQVGEAVYRCSLNLDERVSKIFSLFSTAKSTFSFSEFVVLVVVQSQLCKLSSLAPSLFAINSICENLRTFDPIFLGMDLMGLPRIFQSFSCLVTGPKGEVRQAMLDHKIPADTAMKAYQVWLYLMIEGPQQGLFKIPRGQDSGGTQ